MQRTCSFLARFSCNVFILNLETCFFMCTHDRCFIYNVQEQWNRVCVFSVEEQRIVQPPTGCFRGWGKQ